MSNEMHILLSVNWNSQLTYSVYMILYDIYNIDIDVVVNQFQPCSNCTVPRGNSKARLFFIQDTQSLKIIAQGNSNLWLMVRIFVDVWPFLSRTGLVFRYHTTSNMLNQRNYKLKHYDYDYIVLSSIHNIISPNQLDYCSKYLHGALRLGSCPDVLEWTRLCEWRGPGRCRWMQIKMMKFSTICQGLQNISIYQKMWSTNFGSINNIEKLSKQIKV